MEKVISTLLLFLLMMTAGSANTDARSQMNEAEDDEWSFYLKHYMLVPLNMQTDVTVLGITQSFSLKTSDFFSFDDVYTGSLRFEARRNALGLFTDLSYTSASESRRVRNYLLPPALAQIINTQFNPPMPIPPGTPADARIGATGSAFTIDAGAMYRILEGTFGTSSNAAYVVEPALGARISVLSSELDFELDLADIPVVRTAIDDNDVVLKPLVGLSLGISSGYFSTNLNTSLATSLFSNDDDLSFRISPEVVFSPIESLYLSLGYHYRYLESENGDFGLTQTQHAISIGIGLGF